MGGRLRGGSLHFLPRDHQTSVSVNEYLLISGPSKQYEANWREEVEDMAEFLLKSSSSIPSFTAVISVSFFFFFLLLDHSLAQANQASTDPSEVRALNSLFMQWNTKATGLWNISGEPCSGSAINATEFEDPVNNPAIKCDCSYNSKTTCHITQLRVYALNKHGAIPEDLAALTYLTLLKIDQNFFSGPLPEFIGNLTKLSLLSIAHNAFSGPIPKELGSLKELTMLSLGINNFSGALPPEIGNLVKLEQMYINSCGAEGEIPSTFANLINMRILWASDAKFTGKIPDFIGNWTKMTSLRFQGNSFEGPIPSSFANLVALESLRINDLSNVSSSLAFIKNMKNLTDLSLRNAMISDSIPSDIGEYSLQILDLSFNSLTGEIPAVLFTMNSLKYLFLGSNNLSGSLPTRKSKNLKFIDLSYNELSGKFPSWVTSDLEVNLVANNFVFDNQNISIMPGLHCLQRTFTCSRNTQRYVGFAINCGGQQLMAKDDTLYEAENSTRGGGVAFYNVVDTQKWAVSNVGQYSDRSNPAYVQTTTSVVHNTDTPELYQTSRLSAGSLRYYGLNLENGPYALTLKFAETAFPNRSTQTWQSLGRRIFDVYIQEKLEYKDFEIAEEAGGVSTAIEKNISVNVTKNYLEVHLFWAGKGTCCTPVQGYYGPSISAITVVPKFSRSSGLSTTASEKIRARWFRGIAVAAVASVLLLV